MQGCATSAHASSAQAHIVQVERKRRGREATPSFVQPALSMGEGAPLTATQTTRRNDDPLGLPTPRRRRKRSHLAVRALDKVIRYLSINLWENTSPVCWVATGSLA